MHYIQRFIISNNDFPRCSNDFLTMILCTLKTMIFMILTTIFIFQQWFSNNDFVRTKNNDFNTSNNDFTSCTNGFLPTLVCALKTMIFMILTTILHLLAMVYVKQRFPRFCNNDFINLQQWFLKPLLATRISLLATISNRWHTKIIARKCSRCDEY